MKKDVFRLDVSRLLDRLREEYPDADEILAFAEECEMLARAGMPPEPVTITTAGELPKELPDYYWLER